MFFFQAEDGIRALYVTGVQTCALPIWSPASAACSRPLPKSTCVCSVRSSTHQARATWTACSRCSPRTRPDRKSTRLNSSHVEISYAVFCLKKKKKKKKQDIVSNVVECV